MGGDLETFSTSVGFIWSIAGTLYSNFNQSEYGRVILPFTLLRRLDCLLEVTKDNVIAELKSLPESIDYKMRETMLNIVAGQNFHNTSPYTFQKMLDDPNNIAANLNHFINGFSDHTRKILIDRFKLPEQITRLDKDNLLYLIVCKFAQADLHPDTVSNLQMGYMFEELIRRFSEQNNKTASEDYTPREVIHLMIDLLFNEDAEALTNLGQIDKHYDPISATGDLLSIAEEYLSEINFDADIAVIEQDMNDESCIISKSDMIKSQNSKNNNTGNSLNEVDLDHIDLRNRERDLTMQLHEEKELAQLTLMSIQDAVATTDEMGHITFLNPKAIELTGWTEREAFGHPITEVIIMQEDAEEKKIHDPVQEVLHKQVTRSYGNGIVLVTQGGSITRIDTTASPMFNSEGKLRGCVLIFRDVSEHYETNQKLEWRANHDVLTKLPNRFALRKHLETSINNAQIKGYHLAVGLLDLDDFKDVNDQYGHEMGDKLLINLTQRLRTRMRDGDFLARLSGDELVVVIDKLDANIPDDFLEGILNRLHRSVETPFDFGLDEKVMVGMSMGIALYPQDGDDPDGLIRQADAAMYAAKSNKYSRPMWWRPAMLSLSNRVQGETIDPYGSIAYDLLTKAFPHLEETEEEFNELFFDGLKRIPTATRILKLMSEDELVRLKKQLSVHFKRLISPDLSLELHQTVSSHLGEIHAMTGVETSDTMVAMDDYGRLLRYASQKLPWRVDARLALDSIMQSRLANEIQMQSSGRDQIQRRRVANLTSLELSIQDWIDEGSFASKVAHHLAELPCISGVVIGRPDQSDKFILEFKAGTLASSLTSLPKIDDATQTWRNAWLSGQITHWERPVNAAKPDQNIPPEHPEIRSAVYIPIIDSHGHSVIMLGLYGNYPSQFTQPLMRMWLESVQHMITPAFLRMEKIGKAPIDADTRQHYHNLLFTDHLQIVVQPILNFATGDIKKIEVLARLRDGPQLLSPAVFLPSYGKQALQALLIKGMRQAMDWMVKWDQQGLQVDAAINLPPSVLISPDCPLWIKQELDAHKLAPNRLYLELLETEDDAVASKQRDEAISRLAEIGTRLVMDDLGAGYSSLQRLRTLPFHTVKIDQNLVKHAPSEPTKTIPFIKSLVSMAHGIDMEVVVEGLETLDMVDMAARLGADYGQGYALCKPMLPEELIKWVSDWHASSLLDNMNTPLGEMTNALKKKTDSL